MEFREWYNFGEALKTYIGLNFLFEARTDAEKLRTAPVRRDVGGPTLFGDPEADEDERVSKLFNARPKFDKKGCMVTPLSSYDREITVIQKFANSSPDNFAQVLMFSPLSANVNFGKHWDNYPVLMLILKHYFGKKRVVPAELKEIIDSFSLAHSKLAATIASFKYDTISYVWNNRKKLYSQISRAAESGDDVHLITTLMQIPGVAPVKAGFIAQLIFGRSGCIDTHNIDMYGAAYPELQKELNPKRWDKKHKVDPKTGGHNIDKKAIVGVQQYVDTLEKLKDRGMGTRELWDVWVDFVGFMYKNIVEGGAGLYGEFEPALDPTDPKYATLQQFDNPSHNIAGAGGEQLGKPGFINKMKITAGGKKMHGNIIPIPLATGHASGGGAGATHTIAAKKPEDALAQMNKMAQGEEGPEWARAVSRKVDPKTDMPYNKTIHKVPALLRYFGGAIDASGRVDNDKFRSIIKKRVKDHRAKQATYAMLPGVDWEDKRDKSTKGDFSTFF